MQKQWEAYCKKILFALVIYCLNKTLYAADAGSTSPTYDQAKTEQLCQLAKTITVMAFCGPTRRESICLTLKKALHLTLPPTEIQELIEQGADPKKLSFLIFEPGVESALALPNPRITELCLQDAYRQGYPTHLPTSCWPSSLHMLCTLLCDRPAELRTKWGLFEKIALLRFFGTDVATKDEHGKTARDVLLAHAPMAKQAKLALTFDATINATDFVRRLKKTETDNARSPFLLTHLKVTDVVAVVHEFSNDAEWNKACLPAIQERVAKTTKEPARTHGGTRWKKFMRRRDG